LYVFEFLIVTGTENTEKPSKCSAILNQRVLTFEDLITQSWRYFEIYLDASFNEWI